MSLIQSIDSISSLGSALMPTKPVKISGRSIGKITFDVVVSETHNSTLKLTENPVEDGSVIADHAILDSKELNIVGVVVDYKPKAPPKSKKEKINGIIKDLSKLKSPAVLKNKTERTKVLMGAMMVALPMMGKWGQTGSKILGALKPDFSNILVCGMDNTPPKKRVAQVYADLLNAQSSGEPITVQTGLCAYKNMMITSVSLPQDNDGVGEFVIALKEIFIVSTTIIDGVSVPENSPSKSPKGKKTGPAGKPKDRTGKSGKQGKEKTQKGDSRNKREHASVLYRWREKLRKIF